MRDDAEDRMPGQVETKGAKKKRHPCKVPIRFGEVTATQAATTANLSISGIYIATDVLIAEGKEIHMMLDVEAYSIPLVGTVIWVRTDEEPGKPKGMGVRVHKPPALYQRYIDHVQGKTGAESG